VNIARAGRVETYAVPADTAKLLIRELRGGPAAPIGATAEDNAEAEGAATKSPASRRAPGSK
jgi:hypothetical protein